MTEILGFIAWVLIILIILRIVVVSTRIDKYRKLLLADLKEIVSTIKSKRPHSDEELKIIDITEEYISDLVLEYRLSEAVMTMSKLVRRELDVDMDKILGEKENEN